MAADPDEKVNDRQTPCMKSSRAKILTVWVITSIILAGIFIVTPKDDEGASELAFIALTIIGRFPF